MSKNGTDKAGMTTCHECGCSLKQDNLARHLSKIHKIELTQDQIDAMVLGTGAGVSAQAVSQQNSSSMGLSSKKGLSSGGKKLSKREKREQRQNLDLKKADLRKLELMRRKTRNIVISSVAIVALVTMIISYNMFVLDDGDSSKPTATALPEDEFGEIVIAKSDIVDDVNFYKYDADGTEIRAFGVRGSDGEEHVAFDACDQCYGEKKGYRQAGENMKCNNCGQEFAINSIGTENTEGGCWPSFVDITDDGDNIVLKGEELEEKKYMFE